MVVAGRQVNGGELAVDKKLCPFRVAAEQFVRAEIVAFGLEDAVRRDIADLADGPVGGAEQGIGFGTQGAGIRPQRTGEEGVETGIGFRVRFLGLAQVDPVKLCNRFNEGIFP